MSPSQHPEKTADARPGPGAGLALFGWALIVVSVGGRLAMWWMLPVSMYLDADDPAFLEVFDGAMPVIALLRAVEAALVLAGLAGLAYIAAGLVLQGLHRHRSD